MPATTADIRVSLRQAYRLCAALISARSKIEENMATILDPYLEYDHATAAEWWALEETCHAIDRAIATLQQRIHQLRSRNA